MGRTLRTKRASPVNSTVMRMKYKCASCKELFSASEKIDGYKDGYKIGFLCPLCNANIKDTWSSNKDGSSYKGYWSLLVLSWLIIKADSLEIIEKLESSLGISWNYISGVIIVLIILVFYLLNKEKSKEEMIINTEVVNHESA